MAFLPCLYLFNRTLLCFPPPAVPKKQREVLVSRAGECPFFFRFCPPRNRGGQVLKKNWNQPLTRGSPSVIIGGRGGGKPIAFLQNSADDAPCFLLFYPFCKNRGCDTTTISTHDFYCFVGYICQNSTVHFVHLALFTISKMFDIIYIYFKKRGKKL